MKFWIVIFFTVLGFLGGNTALYLSDSGIFVDWEPLGSPPGGGVEILGSDGFAVFVKTTTGKAYLCSMIRAHGCWHETEWPVKVRQAAYPVSRDIFWITDPPNGVIDTIAMKGFLFEHTSEAKYVLLEDGSVWRWSYAVGQMSPRFQCYTPLGAIVGLLGGLFFASLVKKKTDDYSGTRF